MRIWVFNLCHTLVSPCFRIYRETLSRFRAPLHWWQGVWYEIRWYLFLAKRPSADIGHNPIAQAAMFGYFLMSVFMIITGFALYSEHSQYAILRRSVMWWNFSTGRVATQWTFTAGIGWGCG